MAARCGERPCALAAIVALGVGGVLAAIEGRFAGAAIEGELSPALPIVRGAEKAAKGPYGKTIAHGYLTLSLVPILVQQIYRVSGLSMQVNYGVDKLRFPAPVPVDSHIRAGISLHPAVD